MTFTEPEEMQLTEAEFSYTKASDMDPDKRTIHEGIMDTAEKLKRALQDDWEFVGDPWQLCQILRAELLSMTADRDERAKQKSDFFEEIERLRNKLGICNALNAEHRRVDAPKATLKTLVKCAYEMEELTTMRCCEILGEDVATFRERGWIQSRVLDEISELKDLLFAVINGNRLPNWTKRMDNALKGYEP